MIMNLLQILDSWDEDCKIDQTQLEKDASGVPKVHAKYLREYALSKMNLKIHQADMKRIRLQKYEHYTQGPSEETRAWKMPACGKVMKSEVPMYIDADNDVIDLQGKIDLTQEKIEALESIIKTNTNRGYLITGIMQHARWTGGS